MGKYSIRHCQLKRVGDPDHDDDTDMYKIYLEYDGQTTLGHLPRNLGDDGIVTYATHTPQHQHMWGTDLAAETATATANAKGDGGMSESLESNLGAVAVVSMGLGGVALGTALLAACLAVRKRRSSIMI